VIDRWDLAPDNLLGIVLPPYTGLGVFGGLLTGTVVAILYARWKQQSVWAWADVVAPALFAMQAVGRWGNFFNQELYGPPTDLPWGIPIECQYRVSAYPCSEFPFETTRFQPLFLYESLSALVGMLVLLWLARRAAGRLRQGDLLGVFFVWYGIVRFALEGLRTDNWTFNGVPTAWLFAAGFIGFGLLIIASRHLRPGPSMAEEDARRLADRSAAGGGEPPAGSSDVPEADGSSEPPADGPTPSDDDAPATDPQAGPAGAT
jgi:phosphatidylglycerol:prolipoprotein diacylglycerol transferase